MIHFTRDVLSYMLSLNAASEYRVWLLFYCIPVLSGILPPPFHIDLQYLVCSMHILLSDSIAEDDLLSSKDMLEIFCRDFERLYG